MTVQQIQAASRLFNNLNICAHFPSSVIISCMASASQERACHDELQIAGYGRDEFKCSRSESSTSRQHAAANTHSGLTQP
eukprot:3725872-Amphidinium_carterae.1